MRGSLQVDGFFLQVTDASDHGKEGALSFSANKNNNNMEISNFTFLGLDFDFCFV